MYDEIAALVRQEGWRAEGAAARVHYDGGGDRVAIEFYADAERVLYWSVPEGVERAGADEGRNENGTATADAGTAAPIPRETVPDPLRRRVRDDLDAAGIDPAVERRSV
ncbi:DUF7538 family protein [Halorubrum halodurans]|uniref:Dehydrogenase n=1 Tax=Halorubrum halodurans TaxID=1383851 RepID=A0A256IJ62_9EURY|nr:hypothetical protein [Halorubrum halodurans]OYR56575.1 hypothetical protein DJ70_08420 [Halorubrum halodurans]